MSSFVTPANASVTSYAQQAFGAASQLKRAFEENSQTVRFVRNGSTLLSFDAVVQESHAINAQPTAFPVEDGSTITDHVIRTPRELSLQGIITDTPLDNTKLLMQEAISSAAGVVAGPLGVFALSQAQAFASSRAIAESASPSVAAFRQIVALATGQNGLAPAPFTVKTAIADYPNMVIRSIEVPRDVTTGAALVFGITLTSMLVVASQTVSASITAVPQQNLTKVKEGEREGDDVGLYTKEGVNRADVATGKNIRFTDAPSTYTGDDK